MTELSTEQKSILFMTVVVHIHHDNYFFHDVLKNEGNIMN